MCELNASNTEASSQHFFFTGMPPPVPRPGIPPMTQAQAVSAPGILNRPPAPTAAVPAPQPPVTKPLFPSAGQVR